MFVCQQGKAERVQRMKSEDRTSPVSLEGLKFAWMFVCYRMFPALPYSDATCMWPLSWEPLRGLPGAVESTDDEFAVTERSESVPAKAKSN